MTFKLPPLVVSARQLEHFSVALAIVLLALLDLKPSDRLLSEAREYIAGYLKKLTVLMPREGEFEDYTNIKLDSSEIYMFLKTMEKTYELLQPYMASEYIECAVINFQHTSHELVQRVNESRKAYKWN